VGNVEVKARLRDLRAEMAAQREVYLRAKALEEQAGEQRDAAFEEITHLVMLYELGDSGDKAIGIVAQCRQLVERLEGPREVIERYESLLQLAERLETEIEEAEERERPPRE
jgi:hypothetical protein